MAIRFNDSGRGSRPGSISRSDRHIIDFAAIHQKKIGARMSKRAKRLELVRRDPAPLLPRNDQQSSYIAAIRRNDVVFGVGPAGTGKTFIAASIAAAALDEGLFDKIIICRPIVEAAGEELGFLPGDLNEKCDPYLRPIFDGFSRRWEHAEVQCKMRRGSIEISPLAYMRGRTFSGAICIADEMQNATTDQMMMLLTRLGEGSKIIVTGDPSQRDRKDASGIEDARRFLSGCPRVAFCDFGVESVVRHDTVMEILRRWMPTVQQARIVPT